MAAHYWTQLPDSEP